MKTLLILLLALIISSCSNRIYWQHSKKTPTGKHTYYRAGWPSKHGCTGIYPNNPIKVSNMKRYHYWRKAN